MKALYIIAWIGLVFSVAVHATSIVGSEYALSDIEEFVWILHGGAIFLGFGAVLCSGTITTGTQEKDFWKAVLIYCPSWMKKMVGFFVLYGIVNFIIFISIGIKGNGDDTPASVFRGFSGHWMIFYSIEVAIFCSYLRKFSAVLDRSPNEPHALVDRDCYNSNLLFPQIKKKQYSRYLVLFLIVGTVFCALLWLAFKGYPWYLGVTLLSLFPFMAIHILYGIHHTWRARAYFKKNHNQIWKKSKSSSFADRMEAQRLIKELNDPQWKLLSLKFKKFSTICFWVWLILIVIALAVLAIIQ